MVPLITNQRSPQTDPTLSIPPPPIIPSPTDLDFPPPPALQPSAYSSVLQIPDTNSETVQFHEIIVKRSMVKEDLIKSFLQFKVCLFFVFIINNHSIFQLTLWTLFLQKLNYLKSRKATFLNFYCYAKSSNHSCLYYRTTLRINFFHSFKVYIMLFRYKGRLVTSQRECNSFCFIFACRLVLYFYACADKNPKYRP